MEINLFDRNFAHSMKEDGFDTASAGRKPIKVKWIRNQMEWPVTVFTDWFIHSDIVERVKSKFKIAWILEPPSIHPWTYQQIIINEHKFDFIFTFNEELLARSEKYKLCPIGALRVDNPHIGKKDKLVSIIASTKTQTQGHKFRHQIVEKFPFIDKWGSAYKKFDNKNEPLESYCFSVVVLNSRDNNYFTEALMDCFAFGTIPIFWGCPNIGDFFNNDGILSFQNLDELDSILKNITFDFYKSKIEEIKDNFERVKKYASTDDLFIDELSKYVKLC